MQVQPYLFFDGRCEEALEFYKKAIGAKVEMLMRWKDSPDKAMCPPGNENKVMHARLQGRRHVGDGVGRPLRGQAGVQGLRAVDRRQDEAEADKLFAALSDGGQVQMPLAKTFFSPRFGMLRRQVRRRLDGHRRAEVSGSKADVNRGETMNDDARSNRTDFVISRVLDAPRELVWKCFTDPEHMKQWWGPKGVKVVKSEMDLRPGGTYHYGMQTPDGSVMWGKQVYREIVPPERIVFINSFSDENGGLTRHPMAPTWPMEMLSVFTFEEQPGGKTKFTVRWSPYNATEEERKTFDAGHASMTQGWSGTMDQLEAYLAEQPNRA